MGIQALKVAKAGTASAFFVLLFAAIYLIHARWFHVDVVLYSAVLDALIAATLAAGLLWTPYFSILSTLERLLLGAVWLLAGYSVAISGPTVVDRSFSLYLLEKLAQRGGGIERSAFDKEVMDEFMQEHRLIDVRLTEQLESGTIRIEGDCVLLTSKGYMVVDASTFFRRELLPRKRLLMGEYTDVLTHPLERSASEPTAPYTCSDAPASGQ